MQPHKPHTPGEDGDFGIRPDKAIEYARRRGDDHAGRPAGDKMLGAGNSVREHGVGSTGGGRGKGSGGDVDPDLLGIESLPGRPEDAAKNPDGTPNIGGTKDVHGQILPSGPDAEDLANHDNSQSGGGVANNRDREVDDAFASEITADDASGRDLSQGG